MVVDGGKMSLGGGEGGVGGWNNLLAAVRGEGGGVFIRWVLVRWVLIVGE